MLQFSSKEAAIRLSAVSGPLSPYQPGWLMVRFYSHNTTLSQIRSGKLRFIYHKITQIAVVMADRWTDGPNDGSFRTFLS